MAVHRRRQRHHDVRPGPHLGECRLAPCREAARRGSSQASTCGARPRAKWHHRPPASNGDDHGRRSAWPGSPRGGRGCVPRTGRWRRMSRATATFSGCRSGRIKRPAARCFSRPESLGGPAITMASGSVGSGTRSGSLATVTSTTSYGRSRWSTGWADQALTRAPEARSMPPQCRSPVDTTMSSKRCPGRVVEPGHRLGRRSQ